MDTSAQETFPVVSCWIALDNVNLVKGNAHLSTKSQNRLDSYAPLTK